MRSEDHPLDYGDFEGTIPKGQYGGGTVQLWDRGYWEPEGDLSPEKALEKGDFKFTLEGQRLHGSFVLVRMKHDRTGGKRTNWLLIKHRDEHARDGRWRRHPFGGQVDRFRQNHGRDCVRKGQGTETLYDGGLDSRRSGRGLGQQ